MGQLAGRLKELIRLHGGDERAWQPQLDAVTDLERHDGSRAHALFLEVRATLERARFLDLARELRARSWIVELPVMDPDVLTVRERARGIVVFERAAASARALEAAVAEARALAGALTFRVADADFSPFARVPFARLASVAVEAEALRRRVAAEARVEERHRALAARAARLDPVREPAPDLGDAGLPAGEAHVVLDVLEARVRSAERVNEAFARVQRALRDPAVREYRDARRREVGEEAAALTRGPDRDAAVDRLLALAVVAEALREEAAAFAARAARARRRGQAPPEKERRRGDLQDMFG